MNFPGPDPPELDGQQYRVPPLRYALAHWPVLCRFLADGRVELDTNAVARGTPWPMNWARGSGIRCRRTPGEQAEADF